MLLGAYGWMHDSWNDTFYPEDLPREWQLSYYSNEFNAVLVPADTLFESLCSPSKASFACDEWLDAVTGEFRFYIECRADMFAAVPPQTIVENLRTLQPQLAGLVILDEAPLASSIEEFVDLATELETELLINDVSRESNQVGCFRNLREGSSRFALLENDLLDLRAVRQEVENFVVQFEKNTSDLSSDSMPATIIVNHSALSANDLIKCRSVLEIMGL